MKNIKGFYSFINEGIIIRPKALPEGLGEGFHYATEEEKKSYKLLGGEIICKVANGLVVYKIKHDGDVPEFEVSNKKGIIIGGLKNFKDMVEAVKYANDLVEKLGK